VGIAISVARDITARIGPRPMVNNIPEMGGFNAHIVVFSRANGLDFNQPGIPVAVIKGGSYLCADNFCARFRPAARQAQDLSLSTSHIGFRVVKNTRE